MTAQNKIIPIRATTMQNNPDHLPEPLTPADADLRGFDWMELNGTKLFRSEFWLTKSAEVRVAGIQLWWESHQQIPAGSLPDDDIILAKLADFGRDVNGWKAIRNDALHGWVKCSDGRLYHHVVAETVIRAWAERLKFREKQAVDRERKRAYRESLKKSDNVPDLSHGTSDGHHEEIHSKTGTGTGTGTGNINNKHTVDSDDELRKANKTAQAVALAECVSNSFDLLWQSMPLPKVNKQAAVKAWAKICRNKTQEKIEKGVSVIIQDLADKAEYVKGYDSPFLRTHLSTYLNGEMWKDEDPPQRFRPSASNAKPVQVGGAA